MSDYPILAIGIYLNLAIITKIQLAQLGQVSFLYFFCCCCFRGTTVLMYFQLQQLLGHVHQFSKIRVIFTRNFYMAYGSYGKTIIKDIAYISLKGQSLALLNQQTMLAIHPGQYLGQITSGKQVATQIRIQKSFKIRK